MKMYMLFTKDSHDEKYYVFQGGFDTLGDAFKELYGMTTSKEELYIVRKTTGDIVAEGVVD